MAAYEGGDVKDGGSISGTVKFKGTAPAPKKLDVSKDKEVCGKTPKMDQTLMVNNGNLMYAVVTITDIRRARRSMRRKSPWIRKGANTILTFQLFQLELRLKS